MAYPRFIQSRSFKYINKVDGNLTLNSTSWVAVNGTSFDVELNAQANDVIEFSLSGSTAAEATELYLDVATIISGSPNNWFVGDGSTAVSVPAWFGENGAVTYFGGSYMYELTGSDITTDNTVLLRLMYRTGSAVSKVLRASGTAPFQLFAKNLGPVDPN